MSARDDRGRDGWVASPAQRVGTSLSKLREILKDREVWGAAGHGVCKKSNMTEGLNDSKSEKLAPSDLIDDNGNLLLIVCIIKVTRSRLPSGKT